MENIKALVIRFSLISTTATIHAADCSAAQPKRGCTIAPHTADDVADLKERGFKVKVCKCAKGIK